jgi:hypothetical protein
LVLVIQPRGGPNRKHRFQQFLNCCIRCLLSRKLVYLVMSPRWGSKPRLTDRLVVGRNVTLTLSSRYIAANGFFWLHFSGFQVSCNNITFLIHAETKPLEFHFSTTLFPNPVSQFLCCLQGRPFHAPIMYVLVLYSQCRSRGNFPFHLKSNRHFHHPV